MKHFPTLEHVKVSRVSRQRVTLAESPVWDPSNGRILYLDLIDPAVIEIVPEREIERYCPLELPKPLGGLCRLTGGSLALACRKGLLELCPDSFRVSGRLAVPDDSFEVAPPNDLGVHPAGEIVIATADSRESYPTAGVFSMRSGAFRYLAGGYIVGNGPAFSPDGSTAYIADSPRGVIYAYTWDAADGSMSNQRVFASVPQSCGFPDGLAVDAEGGVWNARWGGASIVRYTPDGKEESRLAVPARFVTSCAFGGRELHTLYITSARAEEGSSDLGGHLFAVEVGRTGLLPSVALI